MLKILYSLFKPESIKHEEEKRENIERLFKILTIEPILRDIITIDYIKINNDNIFDVLEKLYNKTLIYTQDKKNFYIVTTINKFICTIVVNKYDFNFKIVQQEMIFSNCDGTKFRIAYKDSLNINQINFSSLKHNNLCYYLIRIGKKIFFFTNYSLEIKKVNLIRKEDLDYVYDCELIAYKDFIYILCSGIKQHQHVFVYYTIDQFTAVHYKKVDEFGNVKFGGNYLPG